MQRYTMELDCIAFKVNMPSTADGFIILEQNIKEDCFKYVAS